MKIKFQRHSGGRVGGVCPPYRDHHMSKVFLISGSLDTPFAKNAQDYSTNRFFLTAQ